MESAPGPPTKAACTQGFALWFWSFLFFFDLRIRGIDLLPDAIGFGLVAIGAARFQRFHRLLAQIERLAWGLAALSLLDVYQPVPPDSLHPPLGLLEAIVGVALAVLVALLVWWMTQVVADFARRTHAGDTVRAAEQRRLLFIGWQVSVIVTIGLVLTLGDPAGVLVLGVFFGGVAVVGLLMELMLQAKNLCGGRGPLAMPIPETAPTADVLPSPA